ncbi:hypothetical protein [Maioricimonas rarisocia]|nr:hypothetical protein [Maioricimonas rarisocia]
MFAALLILASVGLADHRQRRTDRRRIQEVVGQIRCPVCGERFSEWNGMLSPNHYTWTDDAIVQDIVVIRCAACGGAFDAFWNRDGTLDVQEPW